MNKITQRPQLPIQYRCLNKAETDSFRHEMFMKTSQYLKGQISMQKKPSQMQSTKSEEKGIFIKKDALQRTISVYQWRYKTCYPIVKPYKLIVKSFTGKLQEKKALYKKETQNSFEIWNLDENIFQVIVIPQKIISRLSQVGFLPLPQIFYLLKQIIVGFQCLIDIFGYFQPNQDMIIVNQHNQWRFWISQDFRSNSKKQSYITQNQFLLKVLKMVQSRISNSKVGLRFFQQARNIPVKCLTFLNLLDMTNLFISLNKIMVAKKFVTSNNKSVQNLYGHKNSYFGQNKTMHQLVKKSSQSPTRLRQVYSYAILQKNWQLGSNINKNEDKNKTKIQKDFQKKPQHNFNSAQHLKDNVSSKKQLKLHMKISQLYPTQILSKNNIQKRASFLFNDNKIIKQVKKQNQGQQTDNKLIQKVILSNRSSLNEIPENQIQHKKQHNAIGSPKNQQRKCSLQRWNFETQKQIENKNQIKKLSPMKLLGCPKARKTSIFDFQTHKQQKLDNQIKQTTKQNKNSIPQKRHNLIERKSTNRDRKYSQQIPRIKSLDQFAIKNKKMCESNVIEQCNQKKPIYYQNLKQKDIASHSRNATISGMAFGQARNNSILPSKIQQIHQTIKQTDNNKLSQVQQKQQSYSSRRRATAFQIFNQPQVQQRPQLVTKAIVRISNANNRTAQTLNKSQLHIKDSQQSNTVSNNVSNNVQQSDSSNNHSHLVNRKGIVGVSNTSVLSCKTQKVQNQKMMTQKKTKKNTNKHMVSSQDYFIKNQSEQSGDILKSKNWNQVISGLFNDVASIKILKESSHFGQDFDFFQKQHLKDVKLQQLDKLGKNVKCSIIESQQGLYLNLPRRVHNKSFSLIDQVKQQQYQNEPSCLQYSTSMICRSKHAQQVRQIIQIQKSIRNCQSFQQQQEFEQRTQQKQDFNFDTQFYKIKNK